jgi:hypothetical protein
MEKTRGRSNFHVVSPGPLDVLLLPFDVYEDGPLVATRQPNTCRLTKGRSVFGSTQTTTM